MFYFWNICDISDSRAVILLRCILIDCILNFKFSEVLNFEVYSNTYAKIRRKLILYSWFHDITLMTHNYLWLTWGSQVWSFTSSVTWRHMHAETILVHWWNLWVQVWSIFKLFELKQFSELDQTCILRCNVHRWE